MMDRLKKIIFSLIESLIRDISGSVGRKIRYLYYKHRFAQCGKNVIIDEGVIFENPEKMYFGNNVWIDKYCILIAGERKVSSEISKEKRNKNYKFQEGELHREDNVHIAPMCILQAHGGIYIGRNSGLSSGVKIYSLSNLPANPKKKSEVVHFSPLGKPFYLKGAVVIENNVGIALNSIILPGVTIHKDSFVAPNSVVLTDVSENSFVQGNPARKVKNRFCKK